MCRHRGEQLITIVYLDSHKPFSVAGTLKAKKERVGEEGAGASRGPKKKKKVLGTFKRRLGYNL